MRGQALDAWLQHEVSNSVARDDRAYELHVNYEWMQGGSSDFRLKKVVICGLACDEAAGRIGNSSSTLNSANDVNAGRT